jgi:hypothetical protein
VALAAANYLKGLYNARRPGQQIRVTRPAQTLAPQVLQSTSKTIWSIGPEAPSAAALRGAAFWVVTNQKKSRPRPHCPRVYWSSPR